MAAFRKAFRMARFPIDPSRIRLARYSRAYAAGAVLALGSCLLAPELAYAQKAGAVSDEARQHFNAGVALLRDPDGARYEEAYREFKVAYDLSSSWKVLGNLGLTAMKLERDGEAIQAFERYLAEGRKEIDAAERADIERDLATLKSSAVNVTLRFVPTDAAVTDERTPVQGAPVRNRYQSQGGALTLRVRPGHHLITAVSEGKPALTFEFDAEPGTTKDHEFNFDAAPAATAAAPPAPVSSAPVTPPASSDRPVPTSVWVGVAATGVLAVGAGVTGVLALGKKSDFESANGHDPAKAEDLRDQTKTMNLVTDVLIGAAVVSAGITTYLYLKRPEREQTGLTLRLSPRASVQQTGLSLEGSF
jgi:hypothetical protein